MTPADRRIKTRKHNGDLQLTMSCIKGRDIGWACKTAIANKQAQQDAKPVNKQLEMDRRRMIQVKRKNHAMSHLIFPIMKWNFYDKKRT